MSQWVQRSDRIGRALDGATAPAVVQRHPLPAAQTRIAPRRAAGPYSPVDRPDPVVAGRNADYRMLVQAVVEHLGGPVLLARRGEQVVIKSTLAYNRRPGQGGNVHPDVLRATVELALDAGAAEVVVFDHSRLRAADAYRISGAYLALHRLGDARVKLVTLDETDFEPLVPGESETGHTAQRDHYRVCRHVLEADRLVNLAAARVHPTRRVALGMANLLGLITGGPAAAPWRQHQESELALLAAALQPDLTLIDATHAIIRNGPAGLTTRDVAQLDTMAGSRDLLAAEVYGARLLGLTLRSLPAVRLAAGLGAGAPHLTRARVIEL